MTASTNTISMMSITVGHAPMPSPYSVLSRPVISTLPMTACLHLESAALLYSSVPMLGESKGMPLSQTHTPAQDHIQCTASRVLAPVHRAHGPMGGAWKKRMSKCRDDMIADSYCRFVEEFIVFSDLAIALSLSLSRCWHCWHMTDDGLSSYE